MQISPTRISMLFERFNLGAFPSIEIEDYHGPALSYAYSKSDLDAVDLSPANLIQKRAIKGEETDALRLGRAFHLLVEHHQDRTKYSEFVATMPKFDGRSKEGKAAKEEFNKANFKKLILSHDENEDNERMLSALYGNPESASFLKYAGINEETLIWRDDDTGVICKARPDRRLTEQPRGLPPHIILDWKTIESPKDGNIRQAAWASLEGRRYHVQAAMILDGVKAVHGVDGLFVNVFIEKGGANRVLCSPMEDEMINEGREIYKNNLETIAHCQKTNIWPGFVKLYDRWSRK